MSAHAHDHPHKHSHNAHAHGHSHAHDARGRALYIALALTFGFAIVEAIGGWCGAIAGAIGRRRAYVFRCNGLGFIGGGAMVESPPAVGAS